jgi:hypothetical protein
MGMAMGIKGKEGRQIVLKVYGKNNTKTKCRNTFTYVIDRARILGKMDYFYFLRHVYETCL